MELSSKAYSISMLLPFLHLPNPKKSLKFEPQGLLPSPSSKYEKRVWIDPVDQQGIPKWMLLSVPPMAKDLIDSLCEEKLVH